MLISFKPDTWYRLTSSAGLVLDVVNDSGSSSSGLLKLSPLGRYSGQFWQIRPHADLDGTYELCTWFLKTGMRLGVGSDHKFKLQREGGKWQIVPCFGGRSDEEGQGRVKFDGTYKLIHVGEENEKDSEACWDLRPLFLRFGVHQRNDAQHWSITPIEEITTPDFLRL